MPAVVERSSRAEVRNPLMALPSVSLLDELGDDAREALRAILLDIHDDARLRAETCWRRHKAPMALYWKVVAVYAGRIDRLLRRSEVQARGRRAVAAAHRACPAGESRSDARHATLAAFGADRAAGIQQRRTAG